MSPTDPRRSRRSVAATVLACVVILGAATAHGAARADVTQVRTLPVKEVFERLAGRISADADSVEVRLSFTDASGRPLPGVEVELVDGKDDERTALEPLSPGVFVVTVDRRMVRRSSDLILRVEDYRGLVRTGIAPAAEGGAGSDGPAERVDTEGMDLALAEGIDGLAVYHRGEEDRAVRTLERLVQARGAIERRIGTVPDFAAVLRDGDGTVRSDDPTLWVWSHRAEDEATFLADAIREWVARGVSDRVFLRGDRRNRWIVDGLIETVALDVLADVGLGDAVAARVEDRIARGVEPLAGRAPATWDLNDFQWDRARGFVLQQDRDAVDEQTSGIAMAHAFWRKLLRSDPDLPRRFLDAAADLRESQRRHRRLTELLGELTGGSYRLEVQSFPVPEARAHLEEYVAEVRAR